MAQLVDPEYADLVRLIAKRYLQRAEDDDAAEPLYIAGLKREVATLPAARSLSAPEIDALIKMVIAGARARRYARRNPEAISIPPEEDSIVPTDRISFVTEGGRRALPGGFLGSFSYKSWPLLLILNPATTRLILHSLSGLIDAVPTKGKWYRNAESECRTSASTSA